MTASDLQSAGGAGAPTADQTPDETPDETPVEVPDGAATDPVAGTGRKPRASRRIPKSDAVLEAAVDRARQGILEIAPESQVGRHVSAVVEGERLVTHRFEAFLPGYGGWQWYASLARVPRGRDATVCEVGLLPSEASLRAPEWVPWSERVRPEDHGTADTGSAESPESSGSGAKIDAAPGSADDGAEQPDAP